MMTIFIPHFSVMVYDEHPSASSPQINFRMNAYLPTRYGELIKVESEIFIPRGDDYFVLGTPLIAWQSRRINDEEPGWIVSLTGINWINLGEARWNEENGIRALVESMMDAEALRVQAALLDPKSMIFLVERQRRVDQGFGPDPRYPYEPS